MKNNLIICICIIFIILCMVPCISFGKDFTVIKLSVYEVTINCEENADLFINDKKYNKTYKTFVGHLEDVCVKVIPNKGYEVDSIKCSSDCNISFNKDILEIKNINTNIEINIKLKESAKKHTASTVILNKDNENKDDLNNENSSIMDNNIIESPNTNENIPDYNNQFNPTNNENKNCCCLCWIFWLILIILLVIIYIIWKRRKENKR